MDDTQSNKVTKSLGIGAYASMGMAALLSSRIFGKKLGPIILKTHIGFGVLAIILATAHTAFTLHKAKNKKSE